METISDISGGEDGESLDFTVTSRHAKVPATIRFVSSLRNFNGMILDTTYFTDTIEDEL